ncbi:MAG TPA: thioredoxin family protein [Candidatus Babeliales bacterium]|nr:thioredoxin family protein [Candidatus Babeliales bacterium]
MKGYIYTVMVAIVGLFALCVDARVHEVSSENKLYSKLRRQRFAIVFFYEENKELRCDGDYRRDLKAARNMFHRLSSQWEYTEGDLYFIRANVSKLDLTMTAQQFGVDQFPAFLIFEDGRPFKHKKDNTVGKIDGFVSQNELRTFIDTTIGDQLSDRREYKREVREQRRAEQAYYWSVAPYYYGGYYGDCCYRPGGYFGFGFSI